jgi:hypothetical protein
MNTFRQKYLHENPGVYILATFPPLEGGEKIGTFGSLGKKIDPSEKKNSIVMKKFEFYKQMFFFLLQLQLY